MSVAITWESRCHREKIQCVFSTNFCWSRFTIVISWTLNPRLCIDIVDLAVVQTFTAESERCSLSIYFTSTVNMDVETLNNSPETLTHKQMIDIANI